MTDNEIIKCTEECLKDVPNCKACPFNNEGDCRDKLLKLCLDLINRKNAEIERLKPFEKKVLEPVIKNLKEIELAKSEAIKDFAERLKAECSDYTTDNTNEPCIKVIYDADEIIDNLVKELTEESND